MPPPLVPSDWSNAAERVQVTVSEIVIDPNVSPRSKLDDKVVESLRKTLKSNGSLPDMTVFEMEGTVLLADGHHRLEAYKRHGVTEIKVEQRHGSVREAKLFAVHQNTRHGTRLTREEVRAAIHEWLNDCEFHMWSDVEIAKLCHCSAPTVAKVRKKHPLSTAMSSDTIRHVRRGEKRIAMNTSAIGGKQQIDRKEDVTSPPQQSKSQEKKKPTTFEKQSLIVPADRRSSRKFRTKKVGDFLNGLEALLAEWESSESLGRALLANGGEPSLRERFERIFRKLVRVKEELNTDPVAKEGGNSKTTKRPKSKAH